MDKDAKKVLPTVYKSRNLYLSSLLLLVVLSDGYFITDTAIVTYNTTVTNMEETFVIIYML